MDIAKNVMKGGGEAEAPTADLGVLGEYLGNHFTFNTIAPDAYSSNWSKVAKELWEGRAETAMG